MSRIAKPSPVSAKMYRHFAAITLIITAGLGFFASAENTQSIAQAAAAKAEKNSAKHYAPPRIGGANSNLRDARSADGGADPGYEGGMGYADPDSITMKPGGGANKPRNAFLPPVSLSGGPGLRVPDAETFRMTPAEFERQRKLMKSRKGPPRPPDGEMNKSRSQLQRAENPDDI